MPAAFSIRIRVFCPGTEIAPGAGMLNILGTIRTWMIAAVVLLGAARVDAQTVTLAWDPNGEPDLAGYVIGYGTAPGQTQKTVDVGLATQWTLSGFTSGHTYYFRVYAYNTSGFRSAPSAEVSTTIGGSSGSGTGGCPGSPPVAGWICVNGGWVPPPDTSQPTPDPTPTSCPGTAPGAGWVCVNGGWLPPDSPALWTAPQTACPGTAPGVMWQCVNGGWVPPTSPATQPGSIPCPGTAPGPRWVCLSNGGWVPPDSPLASGGQAAPSTPPSPTACIGSSPGLGWVCVNGGWVPPDHPLAKRGGNE